MGISKNICFFWVQRLKDLLCEPGTSENKAKRAKNQEKRHEDFSSPSQKLGGGLVLVSGE